MISRVDGLPFLLFQLVKGVLLYVIRRQALLVKVDTSISISNFYLSLLASSKHCATLAGTRKASNAQISFRLTTEHHYGLYIRPKLV